MLFNTRRAHWKETKDTRTSNKTRDDPARLFFYETLYLQTAEVDLISQVALFDNGQLRSFPLAGWVRLTGDDATDSHDTPYDDCEFPVIAVS